MGDQHISEKVESKRKTTILIMFNIFYKIVVLVGLLTLPIAGYKWYIFVEKTESTVSKEKKRLEEKIIAMDEEMTCKMQVLTAGITFDQQRKRTLLKFQEIIQKANPALTSQQAYKIAEIDVDSCDKFKRIDKFLLIAIQAGESNFNSKAMSSMGAIGINQIIPSTGRMLCRAVGWEYDKDVLEDIEKSTYLACVYLDMLYVQHGGNIKMILAEYNGGPYSALYVKTEDKRLNPETKDYLTKVINFREIYKKQVEQI